MPYIITTYPEPTMAPGFVGTRRAVATLDEAKGAVIRELAPRIDSAFEWDLGLDGGTIGPLPNGTVIEVRRVLHADVMREAGLSRRDTPFMSDAQILDAFNAQAVR